MSESATSAAVLSSLSVGSGFHPGPLHRTSGVGERHVGLRGSLHSGLQHAAAAWMARQRPWLVCLECSPQGCACCSALCMSIHMVKLQTAIESCCAGARDAAAAVSLPSCNLMLFKTTLTLMRPAYSTTFVASGATSMCTASTSSRPCWRCGAQECRGQGAVPA